MTTDSAAPLPARRSVWHAAAAWLSEHDPGHAALRRAGRTAVVMPAMFALGDNVIGNPGLATFAAFGSFAMLLFVDFTGPIRDRLRAQAALAIVCAVFISVGTLASRSTWVAAVAMAAVAFAVLFAGVVSSVLASATTSLLLAFILPVSLPGRSRRSRIAWLAGASPRVSLLAIALLWPAPARNPLRDAAITRAAPWPRACVPRSLSRSATGRDASAVMPRSARKRRSTGSTMFFATPYRPTGLSTARAVVRLVDELVAERDRRALDAAFAPRCQSTQARVR